MSSPFSVAHLRLVCFQPSHLRLLLILSLSTLWSVLSSPTMNLLNADSFFLPVPDRAAVGPLLSVSQRYEGSRARTSLHGLVRCTSLLCHAMLWKKREQLPIISVQSPTSLWVKYV
ncbi:hypothetical protein JOM56_006577 [Amanita muscaria]